MKNLIKKLEEDARKLGDECEKLHKPYSGAFEDKDPFGVIEDEVNRDYAKDI